MGINQKRRFCISWGKSERGVSNIRLIKKVWGFSKNNWGSSLGAPEKTPNNLGGLKTSPKIKRNEGIRHENLIPSDSFQDLFFLYGPRLIPVFTWYFSGGRGEASTWAFFLSANRNLFLKCSKFLKPLPLRLRSFAIRFSDSIGPLDKRLR